MADKQVNLHPKNDSGTNLKPNNITENIPDKAVTMEKLDQNLQDTIRDHTADIESNTIDIETNMRDINTITHEIESLTSSIATNRADINKNTSDIALLTSKDVAENKNVLIRLECREDGLYVVGTDI